MDVDRPGRDAATPGKLADLAADAAPPVGATLWWLGIVLGWILPTFTDSHPWSPTFVLRLVMLSIIAICVLLGIGLEWRDRRRDGRRVIE